MKKLVIHIIFFGSLFFYFALKAQTQHSDLRIDNLGNIYTVEAHHLVKYDEQMNLLFSYNFRNAGKISSIDVSNPLKILVFYKDLAQIVFLDNTLSSTQGPLSLQTLGFFEPLVVCNSSDKGFWVLDRINTTLHKLNSNLQKVFSIPNLSQILNIDLHPEAMIEVEQNLYINCKNNGLLVFDLFGTYKRRLHYENIFAFHIVGNVLLLSDNKKVIKVDLRTLAEIVYDLPDKPFTDIAFGSSYYVLWDKKTGSFYKNSLKN